MTKDLIVKDLTKLKYSMYAIFISSPFALYKLNIDIILYYFLLLIVSLICILKINFIHNKVNEISELDVITRIIHYVYYRNNNCVIKESQLKAKLKKNELFYAESAYSLNSLNISNDYLTQKLDKTILNRVNLARINKPLYIYSILSLTILSLIYILYSSEDYGIHNWTLSLGIGILYYAISSLICIIGEISYIKNKNSYLIENTIPEITNLNGNIHIYTLENLVKFSNRYNTNKISIDKLNKHINNELNNNLN